MTEILNAQILCPIEKKNNLALHSLILAVIIGLALHIIASMMFISIHSPETHASEIIVPQSLPTSLPPSPSRPNGGIPVLMYHSISTIPNNSLGVPEEQFSEQMAWLYSQGYHTLTLQEFQDVILEDTPVPAKSILLTFDDGYLDNYTAAWSVLKQYHFRATFFIVTDSVGPGMMNWHHLQELIDNGCSVGNHTANHFDLSTLSLSQLQSELNDSKILLEERLGIKVDTLCYPSGRYNEKTMAVMSELGYKLGFTTKAGNAHPGDKPYELKRVRIPGGMSLESFKQLFP